MLPAAPAGPWWMWSTFGADTPLRFVNFQQTCFEVVIVMTAVAEPLGAPLGTSLEPFMLTV